MSNQVILAYMDKLPDSLKNEVIDFIEFLLLKNKNSIQNEKRRPKFGSAKGRYQMSSDFDAPLEDFKEYM
jgi:Protein of unknown function (DUF2281)